MNHPIRLPTQLTDGVVTLDIHRLADAAHVASGEDQEIGRRFDGGRPTTLATAEEYIRQYAERWAVGGPEITYALRLLDGTLIGGAEIRRPQAERADVGYWVYPAFRGAHHARRALALLCLTAWERIDELAEITAHIEPDNVASRHTAEAVGFKNAGAVEENGVVRLEYILKRSGD